MKSMTRGNVASAQARRPFRSVFKNRTLGMYCACAEMRSVLRLFVTTRHMLSRTAQPRGMKPAHKARRRGMQCHPAARTRPPERRGPRRPSCTILHQVCKSSSLVSRGRRSDMHGLFHNKNPDE